MRKAINNMHYSPLRYPGGKNKLAVFIAKICVDNNIKGHYIEPFAGGASVALFLLLEGYVKRITINDKDRSIYAMWYSILHHTDKLCELIANCEISVNTWKEQRAIQHKKNKVNLLTLGFSTLFLNRTNRSGILTGGIIGGINQTGNYKIDCRFNKSELIERIRFIATYKNKIKIYNKDAISLIDEINSKPKPKGSIIYFDPPYYDKGSSLYLNHYHGQDHLDVSNKIKEINDIHWIVSYDNVSAINALYNEYRKKEYSFKHTAYESREGKEVLFFSPGLILPEISDWDPLNFKQKNKNNKHSIYYKNARQYSVKVTPIVN